MRRLLFLGLLVFCILPSAAAGQVSAPTSIDLQDEGTSQGRVRGLNCIGSGITCTVSGSTGSLTIAAGGSGNFVEVSINLGTSGGLIFSVTVTGQAWVTSTSKIVCQPFATTADGQTVETVYAAGMSVATSSLVVGTGFNIGIYSPHGGTGTYRIHCSGA